MAKKLRINGTFRYCAAVYREVFSMLAYTVLVYYLRKMLLADTTFSCYQDCEVGLCHLYCNIYCSQQLGIVAYYAELLLYALYLG